MRVISGKYKGKVLKSPSSDNIRPTGDKVKQALFTKLQFFVNDSVVLDLFAGSGALGIEALSRGAKKVFFVDKDARSIKLLKENLKGLDGEHKVISCDYLKALDLVDQQCDLIILDPPYASGVYDGALQKIYDLNLLNDEGIIVCEHPNSLQINTPFEVFDAKRYGTVTLTYMQHKKN
ncbi:MAG: 16S rRNA (guanine(966)-N(2))-methyltransferase RsmD [Clostridiales bacterium]|nr:16S rRNA (guanine(966)-N(2))-methyltransferase RsmD [Clostridiales bacterium]